MSGLENPAQPQSPWSMHRRIPAAKAFGVSLSMVLGATSTGILLRGITPPGSIALIFLVPVLFSAVMFGFWIGISAAALAFLAYNFFFVEPYFTLRVSHAEDFLALGVFTLVAGLTGILAGRLREQALAAQERARLLEHLSAMSDMLGSCTSETEARQALVRGLGQLTGTEAILFDDTDLSISSLPSEDLQAAERALRRGSPQTAIASGWAGNRYSFYPLTIHQSPLLIVGIKPLYFSAELEKAITSAIEQSSAIISRLRLAQEAQASQQKAERESLRSALLSSLSHDLKTPLATILGSVTSLRELSGVLPEMARDDLLQAIEEDARRLNTYVGNLLHMTRLQTGLDLRLDWAAPQDILNGAIGRIRRDYPMRAFELKMEQAVPLVQTDAILLEQALFNYLDNAAKIAPDETVISASLHHSGNDIRFTIEDNGPGVPKNEQQNIFEPFHRGVHGALNGNGLGLAITKGIVEALGGRTGVDSPLTAHGGACFWLVLPTEKLISP